MSLDVKLIETLKKEYKFEVKAAQRGGVNVFRHGVQFKSEKKYQEFVYDLPDDLLLKLRHVSFKDFLEALKSTYVHPIATDKYALGDKTPLVDYSTTSRDIAVYLPRSMAFSEFLGFALVVFFGLGLLLYYKGGRIQKIVTEKSVITDVRFATIVDFIYCIILFYFKLHSKVPMSTTWVFIGLLAGREVAMAIRNTGENSLLTSFRLMMKDFSYAMIGLVISIAIAIGVNDQLTFASMIETIPAEFSSGITKFFSRIGL